MIARPHFLLLKVQYNMAYTICSVLQFLEVGIQTGAPDPQGNALKLPLIHSTQIYLFSIYSTIGAALWRDK